MQHKVMHGLKLRNTNLENINLVNHGHHHGYSLRHADLYRAKLKNAHMFNIDLSYSSLMKADLRGANLHKARLEQANLLGIKLDHAKLEGVNWGNRVLQETKALETDNSEEKIQLFSEAEEIYRNIGREMRNQGMTAEIGWFFYREMVVRRMQLPRFSVARTLSKAIDLLCGYGEKPVRLIGVSVFVILSLAVLYAIVGIQHGDSINSFAYATTFTESIQVFFNSLYFSIVTFTTLGYGDFSPVGISRVIASIQAITGSFFIALFVVVFVRRMTR